VGGKVDKETIAKDACSNIRIKSERTSCEYENPRQQDRRTRKEKRDRGKEAMCGRNRREEKGFRGIPVLEVHKHRGIRRGKFIKARTSDRTRRGSYQNKKFTIDLGVQVVEGRF